MEYKIFVSSQQEEMQAERAAIKETIRSNQTLRNIFDVFLFEELSARGKSAISTYLKHVDESDIYICIIGNKYGNKGKDGLSATEREFRRFLDSNSEGEVIPFIKGSSKSDSKREKETQSFVRVLKESFIYKRFSSVDSLKTKVLKSLISYIDDKGKLNKSAFDVLINRDATYNAIDENEVKSFLMNRAVKLKADIPKISIKDFLHKTLKIVNKSKEKYIPTNAAILFYARNPSDYIPQSEIRIARYQGTTRLNMIDSQEIKGPIYNMLDEVELFFKRNTRLANKIVDFKRIDIPEYPYEAIREAVVNAMAHRDYFRRGAPIMISIFDDRVEISSPGGLLPGLNIKELEGHHETRNKKICEIFHETRDMEKFGTGIGKIKQLMKAHGLKAPRFLEESGNFIVKYYGPQDKILDLVSSIPEDRQIDLRKFGLNKRQIEVLQVMVNNGKNITITEYSKKNNINEKTARRDFKKLIELEFVEKKGSTKKAYFKAKK
ncbi:MAG: DUF4062 domain-containing protein [Elusimicrobia bacterium]|jgi:ATP-dependent DNA helicase RecG|nr:DUF4062 domain-containing protein [Elusimicrobiota bacterium]